MFFSLERTDRKILSLRLIDQICSFSFTGRLKVFFNTILSHKIAINVLGCLNISSREYIWLLRNPIWFDYHQNSQLDLWWIKFMFARFQGDLRREHFLVGRMLGRLASSKFLLSRVGRVFHRLASASIQVRPLPSPTTTCFQHRTPWSVSWHGLWLHGTMKGNSV